MKSKMIRGLIIFIFMLSCASCMEDEVMVTIHFQPNGGSNVTSLLIKDGNFSMPNDPIKEGYQFKDWYYDDNSFSLKFDASKVDVSVKHTVVLYACWEKNTYTITFDTQGGDEMDPITRTYHEDIGQIIPVNEGYEFMGWYEDPELNNPFNESLMPAYNLMLYAKWEEEVIYRVIYFDLDGGDGISLIRQPIGSQVYTPKDVHKEGHTFLGWYQDPSFSIPYVFDLMPDESITVYAKWQVNMYTIMFFENGGEDVEDIHQFYGTPITLPETTREGSIFTGWFNVRTSRSFDQSTMPEDTILVALYRDIYFNIPFMSNGELFWTFELLYGKVIEAIYVPTPILDGYTFDGWYMDQIFTIPYVFGQPITSEFTLYAKWIENPTS